MRSRRLTLILSALLVLSIVGSVAAQTSDPDYALSGVGGSMQPDLFTGTAATSIPIEVPPGRHGIQPALSLQYWSGNGDGWIGPGWKLEVGAIQRQTRFGVSYSGDDYTFRLGGVSTDVVSIGSGEYRAKIEGGFSRVKKLTATDGKPYWEATDKKGTRYLFGQVAASRQADPADASKIFKWCLDRVEDANGNYMTVSYTGYQGQGYLTQIDYTGNVNGTATTNTVKFYTEDRSDAPVMYTTNFQVVTAKRLKTIDVLANGNRVRSYKLSYATSASTSRSLLSSVQQYGKDATLDGTWTVTGGTALPAVTFSYASPASSLQTPTQWLPDNGPSGPTYDPIYEFAGDFNGDGKLDWMYNYGGWYIALSNGNGFNTPTQWLTNNGYSGLNYDPIYQFVGDFDGDGKTDYMWNHGGWWVALSTGSSFAPTQWLGNTDANGHLTYNQNWQFVADFNGDGKADYMYLGYDNRWYVAISNGSGFNAPTAWLSSTGPGGWPTRNSCCVGSVNHNYVGDFNGDGKADWMYLGGDNNWYVALSNGNGFDIPTSWLGPNSAPGGTTWNNCCNGPKHELPGDFNGDGKTDWMYLGYNNNWYVALSNGNGFDTPIAWLTYPGPTGATWNGCCDGQKHEYAADLNGDGKLDWMYLDANNSWMVALSNGNGFNTPTAWLTYPGPTGPIWNSCCAGNKHERVGDFNGDGKADWMYNYSGWQVAQSRSFGDLLTSVSNGLGGTTTIAYKSSTQYTNTQLPFPMQTVSSITTNDGNGNVSTTNFSFSGGFYHIGERDLRGFNYAKVTGPVGPNGEQTISETWFHQGNDLAVDVNTPNVANGYMKGKPYRARITDGAGHIYSETTTSYTADADGVAPFFTPPLQVDTSICDGGTCSKQTRTIYTYDTYGNVTREDQYGDLSDTSDDRTVVRAFSPNTTAWIVGLPTSETIYQGIGTSGQAAQTSFYYDGTTSCATASTNQTPTLGNLTRVVRWLNGGTSPETRMAYDSYGNLTCTRDANGNTTTVTYDGSFTFPKVVTNALSPPQQKTTQYYGVDGVTADTGLYGQVKSVTDPNNAVISTTYDVFGRASQVNFPDGGWTSTSYNSFGTVGSQNIQTNSQVGLSTWKYFDGLGRTTLAKKTGPDSKTVATQTQYNVRGAVSQTSLPYFYGLDTPIWNTVTYDPVGRVLQATHPDTSRTLACYDDWVTVGIDANNHRKRETRDAYGRLVKVEEYTGTFSTCDTSAGAPYATTTYQYDVLGNLLAVTDTKGNQSTMQYDTLSRKTSMHDPDMGNWAYVYDAAGNLTQQTDAKSQNTYFRYDALNRRQQKDYGTQKALGSGDVMYNYDGVTSNGKGRLTSVQDPSGSVIFYYDSLGRTTRSDKSLDGTTYVTQTSYDTLGRVLTITYPDNAVVSYAYNGLLLLKAYEGATNYGQYAGYNALGQPGTMTFGNGVVTTYTYSNSGNTTCTQQNFRPCTIKTVLGANPAYQDLRYNYDSGGNITTITDVVNGNQTFGYDELSRLTSATGPYGSHTYSYNEIGNLLSNPLAGSYTYPTSGSSSVRPHAVSTAGSNTYGYDNNGNMTSGAGRTLTYDFENRPTSITMPETILDNQPAGQSGNGVSFTGTWCLSQGPNPYGATSLYSCGSGLDTYRWTPTIPATATYDVYVWWTANSTRSTSVPITVHHANGDTALTFNEQTNGGKWVLHGRYTFNAGTGGYVETSDVNGLAVADAVRFVPTTAMTYDGDGGRVKKIAGTTTVRYIGKLYECDTTSGVTACVKYIFAGSQRIAVKQVTNGQVDYYHQDHLGSSSVVTHGTTGVVEENVTYYPFGATFTNTGIADVPYKYTGQELDSSTGLYFYGARYYDPTLGRFTSADTIVPDPRHPQDLNRYTYANNNPLLYTDPTGHFSFNISKFLRHALGPAAPYVITAVAVVASVYTFGAASFAAEASIFESAAAGLTTQEAIGAAIIAAAPTANAVGAIAGGVAGGFVGGSISAGLNGGDILSGGLKGALTGAVPGGVSFLNGLGADPYLTAGVGGAARALINGGNVVKGALTGFGGAALQDFSSQVYAHSVGFGIDLHPGGEAVVKLPGQDIVPYANNAGIAALNPGDLGRFLYEGGPVSKLINAFPGGNALSILHDIWTGNLSRMGIPFGVSNVPAMIPALAVTYGGAVNPYTGSPLSVDITTAIMDRRQRR